MRALCHHRHAHTVLASFLRDTLHGAQCAAVLDVTLARNVGMGFLADQQQRKFLVARIPVIELEGQAPDLCCHDRSHIEGYRAHIDDGELRPGFTQTDEIP